MGAAPGVSLVLDTGYPYQRHDYVIQQYGGGDWDWDRDRGGHGEHKHKHRKHHDH